MSISPELTKEIEKEISNLKKNDFRRPAMTMNKFIGEFSSNLAQAEEDKEALVSARFDWSRMPRYRAMLEMLSIAYGERLGTIMDTPEKREKFDEQMALANIDRRRLGVVASHIAEKCGNRKVLHNYRQIAKGSGIIDTLTDNLALVALIKEYPQFAAEICPGGFEVTADYMDEVVKRTVDLLQMKGIVIEKGVPENAAVERQNRLLTVCILAQSDIKKYARAAFFDTIEYYNSHYASEVRRQGSKKIPGPVEESKIAVKA